MVAMGDLGGSIITGIDGNPLAVLARQLGIPMHAINSEGVPLYTSQGIEANKRLDSQVGSEDSPSGSERPLIKCLAHAGGAGGRPDRLSSIYA